MTDGELDGQLMDGQTDMTTETGKKEWLGSKAKSGRLDGSGREDERTGTGCPSMNAARGRLPKNARSTEIRISV